MPGAGRKTLIILSLALTAAFAVFVLVFSLCGAGGISTEKRASHEAVMTGRNVAGESAQVIGTVDINTASASELEKLPGIGEKLAAAVIAYREENGAFSAAEDIMNVPGIGEGKFDAIKDIITVGR